MCRFTGLLTFLLIVPSIALAAPLEFEEISTFDALEELILGGSVDGGGTWACVVQCKFTDEQGKEEVVRQTIFGQPCPKDADGSCGVDSCMRKTGSGQYEEGEVQSCATVSITQAGFQQD
ncbi:MAG: hypothetical protein KDD66_17515 [Bdellovibrionales bacterium]|nr:hypothetical protein [Bdellovibrionales bacterium]